MRPLRRHPRLAGLAVACLAAGAGLSACYVPPPTPTAYVATATPLPPTPTSFLAPLTASAQPAPTSTPAAAFTPAATAPPVVQR